jgi:hypothetical protein
MYERKCLELEERYFMTLSVRVGNIIVRVTSHYTDRKQR